MVKNLVFCLFISWTVTGIASDRRRSDFCNIPDIDESAIIDASSHDIRLKNMINDVLRPLRFTDASGRKLRQPEIKEIILSLLETEKSVHVPLRVYFELFTETMEAFEDSERYKSISYLKQGDAFCNYLREQFDTNRYIVVAPYYTALLVLSHKSIALPTELCKKIVSFVKVEEPKVFKVDILAMLQIASKEGMPDALPHNLYNLYKQLCGTRVSDRRFNHTRPMGNRSRSIGFDAAIQNPSWCGVPINIDDSVDSCE